VGRLGSIWWLEYCFPYPNIAAMSVSADNLRDNLWKELAKSGTAARRPAGRVRAARRAHRSTWSDARHGGSLVLLRAVVPAEAQTRPQQAAVVQGLHADHVAVFIDEGGSVPPGVLHAAEGIHANPVHSLVVVSGNCDSMEGALYDASVKRAHRYHVIKVTGDPDDPKCSASASTRSTTGS
jgi:hypothetical protein